MGPLEGVGERGRRTGLRPDTLGLDGGLGLDDINLRMNEK